MGNLLQLDLKQLHRVLERWGDEFGALYKFEVGQKPVVVVTDPELNQPSCAIVRSCIVVWARSSLCSRRCVSRAFFRRKARIGNGNGD